MNEASQVGIDMEFDQLKAENALLKSKLKMAVKSIKLFMGNKIIIGLSAHIRDYAKRENEDNPILYAQQTLQNIKNS